VPAQTNRVSIRSIGNGQQQHIRPRAVDRGTARRVAVARGVLVLPVVSYYGVPVFLNVPELGYVELSEERYAELYDKLSSPDPVQVQSALAALAEIKTAEDAEVEAIQHGAANVMPSERDAVGGDAPVAAERDLSEPISFGASYPQLQTRQHSRGSRRLY
jgi:stage V sporulation protein SpoVS